MRTASGCRPEGPRLRRAGERGGGERARGALRLGRAPVTTAWPPPAGPRSSLGSPRAGGNREGRSPGVTAAGRRRARAGKRGGADAPFSLLSELLSHPPPPPFFPLFFAFFLFLEGAAARAHK